VGLIPVFLWADHRFIIDGAGRVAALGDVVLPDPAQVVDAEAA
jgi:hypothetical protein